MQKDKNKYKRINFPIQKEILTTTGLKIQFGEKYFCITKNGNYISEISIENLLGNTNIDSNENLDSTN